MTLPAVGFTVTVIPSVRKSVVLADLLFVAVLVGFAGIGRAGRHSLRRALVAPVVGLLVALGGLVALTNTASAVVELLRATYSMIVLLVIAHVRLTDDEWGGVLDAWIAAALAIAALAVVGYAAAVAFGLPPSMLVAPRSPGLGPSMVRATALMPASTLALYLGLSLVLLVHRVPARPGLARRAPAATLLMVMVGVLTFSRAFGGLVVTLALLARQAGRPAWLASRRRTLTVASVVLILGLAVTSVWAIVPLERRDDAAFGLRVNSRPNVYRVLHLAAVRMFVAHPVLGVGIEEFGRNFCGYALVAEREAVPHRVLCESDWDPHSTWLAHAAEGGIVGLGAWAALYAGVLVLLLRAGGRGAQPLPRAAAAAIAGVVLTGVHLDLTHVKFVWAFLGLALAATPAPPSRPAPAAGV